MKDAPTIAIAAAFVGFWGLVLWVSDAFRPWELAAILMVIVSVSLFGWAACRMAGLADRREEEMRARSAFDWFHEQDDVSDVRNPGLGR